MIERFAVLNPILESFAEQWLTLRRLDLAKPPGVAETIDWANALTALGRQELDAEIVEQTLGSVLKYHEDVLAVRDERLAELVAEARAGR